LERFARDHFDYIVVDEFHHAAATTYRRILDHFEPKFMLGLTATPERTDGGDLLALCDENVVYECGLATGVRQDLLSPFHYFGVPDLVEYEQIPWRGRGFDEDALTSAVATTARADNALAQLRQHGGKRVLGFCVSQRHADFMRDYFREHSQLRCASVHSGPSSDSRSFALEQLGNGDIDVLFCVDMFNEGLDVPSIDTVLMLRPTESKVVWLQQLGRGLRKSANKSHLRVIDYIGNHRSFLEKPAALLAALGVTVTSEQQLARLLAERSFELPPGCDVIYELEALRILEKLCPFSRATLTIREWYEAFRGHAERRPTAREALHSGYKPREVHKDYGSWLEFVREMGDLNEAEQAALLLDRDFLVALETLEWRKSDELVLIDALRATGRLPGSTSVKELSVAYRHRVLRSAALASDAAVNVNDDEALQLFLRDGPIKTWRSRPTPSRQRWFTFQGDTVASAAGIRCGTQPKQRDAFQSLVAEVVEWRIAEFLSRRPQEAVLEVTRGADGEPLLKLDRKRYDLPTDWVWIVADSAPYQAHYLNHVVNEVRAEGKGNQLGSLLKTWFGEEAGKPGAAHRVVQQRSATGELQWKPQQRAQIVDDAGVEIDATFDCEELEGEPTIVFHSRGGDRNNEYARGLEVLLQRLGSRAVQLTRIAVESGATRALPLEQRTLDVEGFPYPINLSTVESAKRLQTRIGKTAAKVGREPGAKGSGNSTKRLRLWLSQRVDEDQLARGEAR
jgi:superfamily II DNA or RNA helicase